MRKNIQRKVNKFVREVNKNVRNDDLWLGRFEIRQKRASFEEFEDKSGGILYVVLRMFDKATGYYRDVLIDAPYQNHHIWWELNNFITEYSGAWDNGYPEAVDYREVKINEKMMRQPDNWHLSAEFFNKEN